MDLKSIKNWFVTSGLTNSLPRWAEVSIVTVLVGVVVVVWTKVSGTSVKGDPAAVHEKKKK